MYVASSSSSNEDPVAPTFDEDYGYDEDEERPMQWHMKPENVSYHFEVRKNITKICFQSHSVNYSMERNEYFHDWGQRFERPNVDSDDDSDEEVSL